LKSLLIIQPNNIKIQECEIFAKERGLNTAYVHNLESAIDAIKVNSYRFILVSLELTNNCPIEIIRAIRDFEIANQKIPAQVLTIGQTEMLNQNQIKQFNVIGQIRYSKMT